MNKKLFIPTIIVLVTLSILTVIMLYPKSPGTQGEGGIEETRVPMSPQNVSINVSNGSSTESTVINYCELDLLTPIISITYTEGRTEDAVVILRINIRILRRPNAYGDLIIKIHGVSLDPEKAGEYRRRGLATGKESYLELYASLLNLYNSEDGYEIAIGREFTHNVEINIPLEIVEVAEEWAPGTEHEVLINYSVSGQKCSLKHVVKITG